MPSLVARQRRHDVELRQRDAECRAQPVAQFGFDRARRSQQPHPQPQPLLAGRMRRGSRAQPRDRCSYLASGNGNGLSGDCVDAGEQSHSTVCATSSGVMKRPCGLLRASSARALRPPNGRSWRRCWRSDSSSNGVSVNPGQTAFTVTRLARKFDAERAHQADDAVLGGAIGRDIGIALQPGRRGNEDDAARLSSGRLRVTSASAALTVRNAPVRLTSIMRSPMREYRFLPNGALSAAPALAMTISIGPWAVRALRQPSPRNRSPASRRRRSAVAFGNR